MRVTPPKRVLALYEHGDLQETVLTGVGAWLQRWKPDWRIELRSGRGAELGRILRRWRGDGAIVAERASWRGDWPRRLPFPAVNTQGLVDEPRLPSVLGDDDAIGSAVAEHLLERGFRSIRAVGRFAGRRADGVAAAARAAGVRYERWHQVPTRLPELLEPVGFACANDATARQLLARLQEDGVRVPESAAVVGINNDPLCCTLAPIGLSSCDLNLPRRGWEAAALLARLMDGAPPPKRPLRIPPRGVVMRASSEALAGADPVLERTWAWLRAHAHRSVQIAELVAASGVSRRNLERRVRERFGFGLREALWRSHVDLAKRLLQEGDQSLLGVALDSGFVSASAFATVFKRHTGRSPRDWRRRWRALAAGGSL